MKTQEPQHPERKTFLIMQAGFHHNQNLVKTSWRRLYFYLVFIPSFLIFLDKVSLCTSGLQSPCLSLLNNNSQHWLRIFSLISQPKYIKMWYIKNFCDYLKLPFKYLQFIFNKLILSSRKLYSKETRFSSYPNQLTILYSVLGPWHVPGQQSTTELDPRLSFKRSPVFKNIDLMWIPLCVL